MLPTKTINLEARERRCELQVLDPTSSKPRRSRCRLGNLPITTKTHHLRSEQQAVARREDVHRGIENTDVIASALAQQLSIQVDNMSAAGVSGELVKSVKYLQTHVVRIMRAQELVKGQIEPPAGNLEHKDTIEKAAEQQKQSAESKLVTDELSKFAAISSSSATTKRMGDGVIEGDKTLSRVEAKLDAIMTKLDNRDGNSELKEAAVDKAPQTNAKENDNGDSPAIQNVSQQPAAMQATPLNVKDQIRPTSTVRA
jgi:hypothetical protein